MSSESSEAVERTVFQEPGFVLSFGVACLISHLVLVPCYSETFVACELSNS